MLTAERFLKVSYSLCNHCLHMVQNSDLWKRKLQRPTRCFSDLDIWITFWGRYKYFFLFFVKEKNPITTSIDSYFCVQIFKEDSLSQALLFFNNISYNQSIVTEFSNRAPQLKEPFYYCLSIACCLNISPTGSLLFGM